MRNESTASKFVKGVYTEYVGRKTQVLGELEVYHNNPVGVGEHSKLSTEVKNRFEELANIEDVISVIERHFNISDETKSE